MRGLPAKNHHWTFLTNHSHVLLCLVADPMLTMREISQLVGITERAVQAIISDLEKEGYIVRHREGRRNMYEVNADLHLRHPVERHCSVGELIDAVLKHPVQPPQFTSTYPKVKDEESYA